MIKNRITVNFKILVFSTVFLACGALGLSIFSIKSIDFITPETIPTPTSVPSPSPISADEFSTRYSIKSISDTDAAPPKTLPDYPGGSPGFSRYVFEQIGDDIVATLVEGPKQNQVRLPYSYNQIKGMRDSRNIPDDLPMTYPQLEILISQLDRIKSATERYRNFDLARINGYKQSTEQIPNMGAHFLNTSLVIDGVFDPEKPEILLYAKNDQDNWELVGISFVQPINLVGFDHPDIFEGPLDNWHVHYELCTGDKIRSHSSTQQECIDDGGVWVPAYGWMIHAWVWVDNPMGVFSMWNPNVPPVARKLESTEVFAKDNTSHIKDFGFENITLNKGAVLQWTNTDTVVHTVTSGLDDLSSDGFDSGKLSPGSSFQLKFDQPGKYSFTCTLHPFMTGMVLVNP